MEAMASSLKPPTCTIAKVTRGVDNREACCWKPYAKSVGNWPFCLRPRPRLQVECNTARSLKEVKPLQAAELQKKFGSENLQFSDVGDMSVVELKMNTGTTARLLLQDARITSYNCRLWHGSLEELLYTDVLESAVQSSTGSNNGVVPGKPPQQFSVIGGMAPSLASSLPPHLSLLAKNWVIESVIVNPDEHIQVTLRCVNGNRRGWQFLLQNVITLTNQCLASALLLTNEDKKPLMFTGSISTHLAIRSTEAICCAGLDGHEYFSPSEAAVKVAKSENSFFKKLKRFVLPFQLDESNQKVITDSLKSLNEMQKEGQVNSDKDETFWFTEKPRELVSLINGVHKVYSEPPSRMRVTDKGFRRSILFENHGFENLEVSSPDSDGDNPYVSIGYSTVLSPITLNKGETWRGAQVLAPDTK